MKEDWLKQIHDRMADFEADEPEGLWNDIVRRLGMPDAAGSEITGDDGDLHDADTATQRPVIPLWARRAVAAAAAVAVILASGIMLFRDGGTADPLRKALPTIGTPAAPIAAVTPPTEAGKENTVRDGGTSAAPAVGQDGRRTVTATESGAMAAADNDNGTAADDIAITHIQGTATDDTPGVEERKDTDTYIPSAPADKGPERQRSTTLRERYADTYADAAAPRKGNAPRRAKHGMTFAAYASGGAAAYAVHGHANGISASIMASNDTQWEDSPLLGMLLYNRGNDVETRISHHLPIRAGVAFTYMISDRFGIESGLTYSYLLSETIDGSDKHYYDGRQSLHYVGIPLNLKYDIVRWGSFGVYGSAGLLAEQCVSGRLNKKYVLGSKNYRTSVEQLPAKPFQLSANVSAGLRYDFTPTVGIYAEPGISYYFDDGTSLETVYKQRPLNFNLNVGIRFTVGR